MDKTPNLHLPYILSSQAQKHITHNDAIRALDALVHLSVLSNDLTVPPSSPLEGDRYIVHSNPSNEWIGQDNKIAAWQDGTWQFYAPQKGWVCWIENDENLLAFNGLNWTNAGTESIASINPTPLVGVNAIADTTNRLSVNSPATLFNHEGNHHRLKINKQSATDTASVLFQNNFSGYAEFGLTGDNNFHMKVSPDGNTFHEGIIIDKDTGHTQCSRIYSGSITITDDSIGEIATPYAGGFVFITINDSSWPQVHHSGILAFDTGLSLSLVTHTLGPNMSNWGGPVLTGTYGGDGRTNIAVKSGAIVIENRFGSTQKYSYTFLG